MNSQTNLHEAARVYAGRVADLLAPVYAEGTTPFSRNPPLFIKSIGIGSRDGIFPGVDLKSGWPEPSGRGFAFIAPTSAFVVIRQAASS